MDVSTAYLNADMKDTIYMKVPQGYIKTSPDAKFLKLEKALYGGVNNQDVDGMKELLPF
jgi:hypothetical protein